MKAVVTGGLGFIGSHLCERLLRDGHTVTIVDDLSTGALENTAHLGGPPQLTCHIGTILNKDLMRQVVSDADVIFHLAAVVGVRRVIEKPLLCLETNVRGTDVLLELAAQRKVPVLLASSSEVYGKNGSAPFKEDDERVLGSTSIPRWVYSVSKTVDECLGLCYCRERGLPVVVVRFFNIVGPRQTGRYGMVLPTFARQALSGRPITVFGDGRQVRSFTYVSDAVAAMMALAGSPRAVGEVFNVGSDDVITIEELAQTVKALAGSDSPIAHIPLELAYGDDFEEPRTRVPDISKLRSFVGYEPQVHLEEMIGNILDYCREHEDQRDRLHVSAARRTS